MIWVRFYGTRVLDTSLTKLKPVEVRKFHDLAKGLAGVPQGKRDEEHMDGAEFTVLQAPPSASSGGKRDSKKKPAKPVVLKPVKVTTRHEDLVAKDLRKALHMAFDRKRPSKRAMRGAWVRARDFASAMGLDANDAKDVGALLTRQKLVAVPAPGELTDALRWPGVLIPFDIDKLPKAKPGKPLIVQSSDRYFVVDAWSFARK